MYGGTREGRREIRITVVRDAVQREIEPARVQRAVWCEIFLRREAFELEIDANGIELRLQQQTDAISEPRQAGERQGDGRWTKLANRSTQCFSVGLSRRKVKAASQIG